MVAEYRPLIRELSAVKWEMLDSYEVIYTSHVPVAGASITASAMLVDGFGRESEAVIYQTWLDGRTASQVNWNNTGAIKPELVWNTVYWHPLLK